MLTFFRRIRKGLLDGGTIRKYLVYAIGEIFLVVIGILIAVQINNWNLDRLQTKAEKSYLLALVDDLQSDLNWVNRIDSLNQRVIDTISARMQIIYNKKSISEKKRLAGQHFMTLVELNPRNTAFDEMKNTGGLYSMKNKELKEKILEHYRNIERRKVDIYEPNKDLERLSYIESLFDYYIFSEQIYEGKDSYIDVEWMNDFNSKEFKALLNFLMTSKTKSENHVRIANELIEETKQLIEDVESELYPIRSTKTK